MFAKSKLLKVIGSDVRCIYGEHDRIASHCLSESATFRAEYMEGSFGENKTAAVKQFFVGCSEREVENVANAELLMRWDDLTKLKHENVVSYHCITIRLLLLAPAVPRYMIGLYIVMDYCDGTNLQTMIHEVLESGRTFPLKTLFDFSKQMAHGVAYLHKNNIIHGDLKPVSILISQSSGRHFRLRLGGLDNFTASYATYALNRNEWEHVAPEVRSIFAEVASYITDDPYYTALHLYHKRYSVDGVAPNDDSPEAIVCGLVQRAIAIYASFRINFRSDALQPQQLLLGVLQGFRACVSQDTESSFNKQVFLIILDRLLEICAMDLESAKHFCAKHLQNRFCTRQECTAVPLQDNTSEIQNPCPCMLMSMYFQHLRDPSATELSPEKSNYMSNDSASLNRRVKICGPKADIWSLGCIVHYLARLTFDGPQGFRRISNPASTTTQWLCQLTETFTNASDIFYLEHFEPKDFMQIVEGCEREEVKERSTAEEVINKLVALEEHTYGNTWVGNSSDNVTEDDTVSHTHRQMFEEIGCTCKYSYTFWKDFVGQGTYGTVYKAVVTVAGSYNGNDTVAVKKITLSNERIKQMQQNDSWERAKQQWQKLVDLKHPHLVTYHKCAVWKLTRGADIEFMMDYCEGGDLDVLIAQCKTGICSLSVAAVTNYAKQLASGLHFFHQNQFIHGDLKPGNVFMNRIDGDTGTHTLRIGDLDGAVRIRDGSLASERRDLAGTGPYMSPEMVNMIFDQEDANIGFPTDVWSLGCVILDLANCSVNIKKRIFFKMVENNEGNLELNKIERKGFFANAFLLKMAQGYRPFVSDLIGENLRDVIRTCLITDCSDRATTARVLDRINSLPDVGTR